MLWVFFHPHLRIKSKASAYMYRHLLHLLYANALDICTCFRFYTQMRVEKNPKHLHIEFIVTSHNSVPMPPLFFGKNDSVLAIAIVLCK